MAASDANLTSALKRYFGFDSFRPLQEQIIHDSLAGKDVFALLPTGGGKSLCFQLPALVQPGLTIVVSPLIALMKDQVDALQSSGVAATFLNSSLSQAEARERVAGLYRGEFKLLYVAPERLMLPGFLDDAKRWNVQRFAIDEAHCISEWGHDFRPEYRQLSQLREKMPSAPVMALTATATERVRGDIVRQLKLREPACYVASFNRPNLTYRVLPKDEPYEQVLEFIRSRPKDSGIVYCYSRKGAESVADRLTEDGISARAYHAGLDGAERNRNQEMFLRDKVRVICATIAFGMGINKPNVRFVIHYDLPKNIEGYYQETGRAGRDGLPSECLLLFSAGDVVKQDRFIDEKPTEQEKQVARAQLQQMVHYAEWHHCRRAMLLQYFWEKTAEENCGGCDNCLSPRETFDGTVAAQKFLSCVYRVHQCSGFAVGLGHIVDVLLGSSNEKVLKWGHDKISTYGIGKDLKRQEWQAIGRELVRLGFVRQNIERFNVLELTAEGRAVLRDRTPITLTKAKPLPERKLSRIGDIACDEGLFERLRGLRRKLAEERGVPPYIVFSDVTLREMAREYPQTERELMRISGVGERKLDEYGETFLLEIADHLQTGSRQVFVDDKTPAAPAKPPRLADSMRETVKLFKAGASIADVAKKRDLAESTIVQHLAAAILAGEDLDVTSLISEAEQREIAGAFRQHGTAALAPVKEALGHRYDYSQLQLSRAMYQREQAHRPGVSPS